MINMVLKIVAMLIVLVGTISIFEARNISNKYFSFGDKNTGVGILKIVGFILCVLGLFIIKIVMK